MGVLGRCVGYQFGEGHAITSREEEAKAQAAHYDAWVNRQSALTAADVDLLAHLHCNPPPATLRRAGPGGVIGGTRVG